MAQQQWETLVTGWPVPRVHLVIDQPLIGAGYRNGNMHQEVTVGKGQPKSRKPWVCYLNAFGA
jgi:hypothetical protein